MFSMRLVRVVILLLFAIAMRSSPFSASEPGTGDWPMWGGTPDRNMVSARK